MPDPERHGAGGGTAGRRMSVARLVLTDFRSYHRAEIRPGQDPVVLTGANGAGKTNILEALSFLVPGRGLRSARLADVTRQGAACGWAVAATVGSDESITLGTGLQVSEPGLADDEAMAERRLVRIDGLPAAGPAALGAHLRMVWLTPQMDGLFLDSGSSRRKFLDRLVATFHPGHGSELNAYERATRERNRLLVEGRGDPLWLDALETQMACHGTAVAAARLNMVRELQLAIDLVESAFPRANLSLKGDLEEALLNCPAVEAEDRFRARLKSLRRIDAAAGRTTAGPHRTDLQAEHQGKAMPASLCSTGEQKALLIGVTLASARMITAQSGVAPVVLLDEVAAHLDEFRRGALFDEITGLGAQVWLTGADQAIFSGLEGRAAFFRVAQGAITALAV